jgi:transposase-like protein
MEKQVKEPQSLQAAILYFSDPDRALAYMVTRRWRDGVILCPTCGADGVRYIATRRLFECAQKHAKRQFSVKVGTVMEDSAIPLDKWLMAFWMVANCKNGVSSYEIHRAIGVTQKSAWFMVHRIRLALQDSSIQKFGSDGGAVESDEAFVGGKPANMHKSRKVRLQKIKNEMIGDTRMAGKTAILGLLDREQRKVRATVIPAVNREHVISEIVKTVQPGARVYTDEATVYTALPKTYTHEFVNHLEKYVSGQVHTNGLENFWSLLKRGLKGTYVAVEPHHLFRYVDEQVFRYNNRATRDNPLTDADRFDLAVSQIVSKRLTYAELTGKVGETSAEVF